MIHKTHTKDLLFMKIVFRILFKLISILYFLFGYLSIIAVNII
jgi:hypothetical protein